MAKSFAPRTKKKNRNYRDIPMSLDERILEMNDNKLLKGAQLEVVRLDQIEVRAQVRTKFNDESLAELAENIQENGLIQPLVINRDGARYVLICGERRYRAMSSINMIEAPCFVLKDKTPQELMAIQFSENSSREDLHYIDKANSISDYKQVTGASERKIVAALGISKTEVHRSLLIAKLPVAIKEAAKAFNTEKYVLLEWGAIEDKELKKELKQAIISGHIVKRSQLSKAIRGQESIALKSKTKKNSLPKGNSLKKKKHVTTSLFVQALKQKSKELDPEMQKMLAQLVKETKEMVERE